MPRPPRLHVPGGCYHVILRGNHREALFGSAADCYTLNDIVAQVVDRFTARIHAYCWMSNHLHALIQIAGQPLGKTMQCIAMRYSRYRHKALQTSGHLFERRYKAKLVEVDAYFLTLLRDIHSVAPGQSKASNQTQGGVPELRSPYCRQIILPIPLGSCLCRRSGVRTYTACPWDSKPAWTRV